MNHSNNNIFYWGGDRFTSFKPGNHSSSSSYPNQTDKICYLDHNVAPDFLATEIRNFHMGFLVSMRKKKQKRHWLM